MKKILIGIYLCCALVYFALNSHRVTVDYRDYKTTGELQSLNLAVESLLFPLYLTYYHFFTDGQAPPVGPHL